MVVNKKAFRKLDKPTQDAVLAAAAAAEKRGLEMSRKETAEQIQVLKDNGIIIVTPSAELMAGLKKVGDAMMVEWEKNAGAEGKAMLEAYRK